MEYIAAAMIVSGKAPSEMVEYTNRLRRGTRFRDV